MNEILIWGLNIVKVVQTIANPFLTTIMKAITYCGSDYFYVILLAVIFLCINSKIGLRMAIVLVISAFINFWLKDLFAMPRPYNMDPLVGFMAESSYGLPSGHAQASALIWTILAFHLKNTKYAKLSIILAVIMPLLISFTRIYLGVHFPTDIALGLLLGWMIAAIYILFGEKLITQMQSYNIRIKIVAAALIAFGMNALTMKHVNMSGLFLGLAIGGSFLFSKLNFNAGDGTIVQKIIRLILIFAGLAVINLGLKIISPSIGNNYYALIKFVRYTIIGLWISFIGPWLYIKTMNNSFR